MSKYVIAGEYPVRGRVNEISVEIGDYSYLVIYGLHINGGFCAIPQSGVSCELSAHDNFGDIGYNATNIHSKIKNKVKAQAIAEAIHVAASAHKDEQDDET